jgi:hypothetical protein
MSVQWVSERTYRHTYACVWKVSTLSGLCSKSDFFCNDKVSLLTSFFTLHNWPETHIFRCHCLQINSMKKNKVFSNSFWHSLLEFVLAEFRTSFRENLKVLLGLNLCQDIILVCGFKVQKHVSIAYILKIHSIISLNRLYTYVDCNVCAYMCV